MKKWFWHRIKESTCQCSIYKRRGFNLWVRRSLGEGNGNPLQYSCLGNPIAVMPGGLQSLKSQRVRHDWAHTTITSHWIERDYFFLSVFFFLLVFSILFLLVFNQSYPSHLHMLFFYIQVYSYLFLGCSVSICKLNLSVTHLPLSLFLLIHRQVERW